MSNQNPVGTRDAILFQFDIAWELLACHLKGLQEEECLWRPSRNSLHVHYKNGVWQADWPTRESYDLGPSSIAWTMWHILFWWSMALDHSFGSGALVRESVCWPGSTERAKQQIAELHGRWRSILETMPQGDFLSAAQVKWPFQGKPFDHLAAWLNLELIKNASEIGAGRFLYAAQTQ